MAKRKSITQTVRFEIFKRDGFRCVYCGSNPIQAALRVDHVVPVSEGGTNSPTNLVAACFDCNSGKSAKRLENAKFIIKDPKEVREHAAQVLDYLASQREVEAAQLEVQTAIAEEWERVIGPMTQEMFARIPGLTQKWPIEKLHEAISIVGAKFGYSERFDSYSATKHTKYFYGILRRWTEES